MNQKKIILLLLAGVFVFLLVGAGVLYSRLGEQWAPDNLLVQTPTTQPVKTTGTTEPTSAGTEPTAASTAPAGQPTEGVLPLAPDFTVYDAEGNPVSLSDYFGKPIVLNFWASWCGPCRSEMPDFQEKYEELGEEIQFLMINMTNGRETLASATSFIEDSGYTFPVFYDTDMHAATVYSVYALPTTYFIDAQGHAIARAPGAINADILQQGIDMITNTQTAE